MFFFVSSLVDLVTDKQEMEEAQARATAGKCHEHHCFCVNIIVADVSWICIIVDATIRTFTHEPVCQLEPGQSHVAISQLSCYYSSNVVSRYYKVLVTA